mgnify:CR=1 FL=1
MTTTSVQLVSSHFRNVWEGRTAAETIHYAKLQINVAGILYPVVPTRADKDAICIGLPSGLCDWLEQYLICTNPEDSSVIKEFDCRNVEMCFLWVALSASDAFQYATPEVLWKKNYQWPAASAVLQMEIPKNVHITGSLFIYLRWRLSFAQENQTVQELDIILRGGISKGPWSFYSTISYVRDTPQEVTRLIAEFNSTGRIRPLADDVTCKSYSGPTIHWSFASGFSDSRPP